MTGTSGSASFAARSTPKPSPRGSRRSVSTTRGPASAAAPRRRRLIAGFDDGVPLRLERMAQHRAQRVSVFDEQDRIVGRCGAARSPALAAGRHRGGQRSQPGGTPSLRASSSIAVIACF